MDKLTLEEQEIIDYIENNQVQSIPNVKDEILKYTQIAKEHNNKKKSINIKLLESDLYLLKQNSLKTGISYQDIIQKLVHQYTTNKIKLAM
jgi:predicted DNA binding CopG/RHH family protein